MASRHFYLLRIDLGLAEVPWKLTMLFISHESLSQQLLEPLVRMQTHLVTALTPVFVNGL